MQEVGMGGRRGGGGERGVKSTWEDEAVGKLEVVEGEDIKVRDGAWRRTTVSRVRDHGKQRRVKDERRGNGLMEEESSIAGGAAKE